MEIWMKMLPVFLAADLAVPFLLAPSYRGYSHRLQAMSALGNPKAPLHRAYNIWLMAFGIYILIGNFALFFRLASVSVGVAAAVLIFLDVYALGACVLSGLCPVDEGKKMATRSAKIHGYGSAIGFMALAVVPLLVGAALLQGESRLLGLASMVCLGFGVMCFVLFVLSDKPAYRGTPVAWEGLWQRLALLFFYIPLGMLCWMK